jgi:hypothetical protein
MKELDVAWLAGILEGEGCFHFNRTPKITVAMTDEDVIAKVASLFGKGYRHRKSRKEGNKDVYTTEVFSVTAIEIMNKILPYMGIRRTEKIKEVILTSEGRLGTAVGERAGMSKLTNIQARDIYQSYKLNSSRGQQTRLAEKYGVTCRAVNYIVRGKTYQCATAV